MHVYKRHDYNIMTTASMTAVRASCCYSPKITGCITLE